MINGLTWYTDSQPTVQLVGHGDLRLGAALLAATSPRCQIIDNLRRALRRASPLPCHTSNLTRALAGAPLRGPKVTAFAAALAGDLDAIPVDIWLLRRFSMPDDPALRHIREVQRRVRIGARLLGRPPRDHAAQLWVAMITARGRVAMNYATAHAVLFPPEVPCTTPLVKS